MKKIELTDKEQYKFEIIKNVVDGNMTKHTASFKLDISIRQINRLITSYEQNGKEAFKHKNRNRKPSNTIPEKTRKKICKLYLEEQYYNSNIQHFTELLAEHHQIELSRTTISEILKADDILSPQAHKKTKRSFIKELKQKQDSASTKNEKILFEDRIVALERAHPNKSRKKYFGELIQMDASKEVWFGTDYSHLHIAIDDCTGHIVGAYFDKQETLHAYYTIYKQILMTYGIPHEFLTDYRTVFEYHSQKKGIDTLTQFGYACRQLGTILTCTFVPQAKGRVERVFRTLQSRLITEFKIHNINNIDEANEFLNSYIKKFNNQFAYDIDYSTSVFEKAPIEDEINIRLGILNKRKIGTGHHFKYNHNYYIPSDSDGKPVFYPHNSVAVVIQAFDGTLYVNIKEKIYLAKQLDSHELQSFNFDYEDKNETSEKKKYIPPMSHPWKLKNYNQYFEREKLTPKEWDDLYYSQENVLANPHKI